MADTILVLNAGSSSLKFSVFPAGPGGSTPVACGQVEGLGSTPRFVLKDGAGVPVDEHVWPAGTPLDHAGAFAFVAGRCAGRFAGHRFVAVGHRVVHGGVDFTRPVRVDPGVLAALGRLVPLAPLHQPHNLAAIRAVADRAPHLPQVACFDTAFHRTQPEVAQRLAIPRRFAAEGVRRYGFHGLSYEHIAATLPGVDPRAAAGRTVVAHLGNGASMCGLLAGRSVATTMGFSTSDGLVMGSRTGLLDPGVLLYLAGLHGMDAAALEDLVYHRSGLLGVSGLSGDMRTLLASDDPRAAEAVELFVYRAGRELGSLAAALGGLDALIFTGGIGENSAPIRAMVCRAAAWLGVDLDAAANEAGGPRISRPGGGVAVWVLPADEESMIAEHTRRVLDLHGAAE